VNEKQEKRVKLNVKCSCKGYNLDKLLQPVILTLLIKNDLHGYKIVQTIEEKNLYREDKIDTPGIYRTLKNMEERGLVSAQWTFDGSRPAKKIYAISTEGRTCLSHWVNTLEDYEKTIDIIIQDAKNALS